jgi:hypothetical protein
MSGPILYPGHREEVAIVEEWRRGPNYGYLQAVCHQRSTETGIRPIRLAAWMFKSNSR